MRYEVIADMDGRELRVTYDNLPDANDSYDAALRNNCFSVEIVEHYPDGYSNRIRHYQMED